MAVPKTLSRVLDANFNRAKEGLRVCEDVSRFCWDQASLSKGFKILRHDLQEVIVPLGLPELVAARDIGKDVGKGTIPAELKRREVNDVFWANSQRVKESLRVLEELTKLVDAKTAASIKEMRYRVYALEQKANQRR